MREQSQANDDLVGAVLKRISEWRILTGRTYEVIFLRAFASYVRRIRLFSIHVTPYAPIEGLI